jgi:hypothetical protein
MALGNGYHRDDFKKALYFHLNDSPELYTENHSLSDFGFSLKLETRVQDL